MGAWHAEAGPSGTDTPKAAYDERASGGYGRATLVICPLVAVLQWRQEIERFTTPGTLKVHKLPYVCTAYIRDAIAMDSIAASLVAWSIGSVSAHRRGGASCM